MSENKIKLALKQHGKNYVFVAVDIESGNPRYLCKDGSLSMFCDGPNILPYSRSNGGTSTLMALGLTDKYEMVTN